MDRIKGLKNYISTPEYRAALGLPEEVEEYYALLAQGEYNINYKFVHPFTEKQMLLRVNCGSQMHLDNQIEYEAKALSLLKKSGRVPRVYYVDGSRTKLDHGVLVMEYLPGRSLDYKTDIALAAEVLSDIHSVPVSEGSGLIHPKEPLRAILRECESMVSTYMESDLADNEKKVKIRRMLDNAWKSIEEGEENKAYNCCINTELNSTNFLINGEGKPNYLIDWEKPICGDPAQDLGHFLAPTTTFWKTDVILSQEEIESFIDGYIKAVDGRFSTEGLRERVHRFIPVTCMRGITWCAMAWVQYQDPDKLIFNESTFRKLEAYLSHEFLGGIEDGCKNYQG